jgi:outer membrane protein
VRQGASENNRKRAWPIAQLLLGACAALAFSTGAWAQTGGKIGYVDLKRLLDNAPQMSASKARLERDFTARDAALKADEAKLTASKQRYDRDGAIMSKADAEALKREIDALDRSNKRTREDLRTELNTRAASERDRIWLEIQETVITYARSQGYDLLIPSPVIYFDPRIDVTDALIERLKRSGTSETTKP